MKPTGILCPNIGSYDADHSINEGEQRRYFTGLSINASCTLARFA